MAIDGFEVDVPDTPANAERFAYSGSHSVHQGAYPKARVVVAECGADAFLAIEGESTVIDPPVETAAGSDVRTEAESCFMKSEPG